MKRITYGEWRYALLLIPLLILAAYATVRTVDYIEDLIISFEHDRAWERLEDHFSFEQQNLVDLARYAGTLKPFSGARAEAFLDQVTRAEQFDRLKLIKVAVVDPEGIVLASRFMKGYAGTELESEEDFLAWTNTVPRLSTGVSTWVGFARASTGPVLLALARVTPESGSVSNAPFLGLVRPLDDEYLHRIQQTYPAFCGLATPETVKEEGTHLAPIRDVEGRQIGAFLFRLEHERIDTGIQGIRFTILALTMGFLFLAGALGLWAMRATVQIESRRRLGRFVDAMDYLRDGLVAVHKKCRITGCNPSARAMVGKVPGAGVELRDMFPNLSDTDVDKLFDGARPHELEKTCRLASGPRICRFRSQPCEDVDLLLISDVTDERTQEMRRRQVAALQMIGRVARGVAHDFNNILCAVSGHASLLGLGSLEEKDRESLHAITEEADRGAALAAQLLQLSRVREEERPSGHLLEDVAKAAELLRVGLSSGWEVSIDAEEPFPEVPLSAVQVQQVILNLGLLVADELPKPGVVRLVVHEPGPTSPLDAGREFAVLILLSAHPFDEEGPVEVVAEGVQASDEETGVIQSVVRTMLEEVGGCLDVLVTNMGRRLYRVCLPEYAAEKAAAASRVPDELATYMGHWQVFLALPETDAAKKLADRLAALGTKTESASDIVGALSKVDRDEAFTAMVFDRDLLGAEGDGLLRAILKLQPSAGLVVLCETLDGVPTSLEEDIVFERRTAAPDVILEAMIRSRELAGKRKSMD